MLFWVLISLLAVVAACLLLPLRVVLSWNSTPIQQAQVSLRALGGITPAIPVYDSTWKKPPKKKRQKPHKQRPKRSRGHTRGGVVSEVLTLFRRVLGAIQLEKLRLDAEFGLGDPAETGQLFGQLCPLIYGTGGHVRLRPNFDERCLKGEALAQFRLVPFAVLWPFVGFGWRVFGPVR